MEKGGRRTEEAGHKGPEQRMGLGDGGRGRREPLPTAQGEEMLLFWRCIRGDSGQGSDLEEIGVGDLKGSKLVKERSPLVMNSKKPTELSGNFDLGR